MLCTACFQSRQSHSLLYILQSDLLENVPLCPALMEIYHRRGNEEGNHIRAQELARTFLPKTSLTFSPVPRFYSAIYGRQHLFSVQPEITTPSRTFCAEYL